MTSTPEAMERKIRQLDNDVQSIYEMLSGIAGTQRRHDNRFEEIGSDVSQLKGDVTGLKADVAQLKGDVNELKGDVSQLKGDVTQLKGGLAAVDTKVDQILALLQR